MTSGTQIHPTRPSARGSALGRQRACALTFVAEGQALWRPEPARRAGSLGQVRGRCGGRVSRRPKIRSPFFEQMLKNNWLSASFGLAKCMLLLHGKFRDGTFHFSRVKRTFFYIRIISNKPHHRRGLAERICSGTQTMEKISRGGTPAARASRSTSPRSPRTRRRRSCGRATPGRSTARTRPSGWQAARRSP